MKRTDIIRRIADVMHRTAPNARVILYGSQARGDARPDSDIDLLILVDDSEGLTPEREFDLRLPLTELEVETGALISCLFLLRSAWEKMKTPFTINVNREGVLL